MAESWEAYSLNRNVSKLDKSTFASYRSAVIKESDSSSGDAELLLKEAEAVASRPALGSGKGGTKRDSVGDGLPTVTPPAKRFNASLQQSQQQVTTPAASAGGSGGSKRVSLSPYPPGINPEPSASSSSGKAPKYSERPNSGKVVFTFQPAQELTSSAAAAASASSELAPKRKCVVSHSCFPTNVRKPYRHAFTTLEERSNALNDRLEEMGDYMKERYGLGNEDGGGDENGRDESRGDGESGGAVAGLEAVGVPRQEKVCCIGRICNSVSCKSRREVL